MAIACPACNKANQTEPSCQRCGCDLTSLHEIEWRAQSSLAAAATALARRDWTQALNHAERSWELQHGLVSAQLASLAAAALGDAPRLSRWRGRVRRLR